MENWPARQSAPDGKSVGHSKKRAGNRNLLRYKISKKQKLILILFMLVSALMGLETMKKAYAHAVAGGIASTAMEMRVCCCRRGWIGRGINPANCVVPKSIWRVECAIRCDDVTRRMEWYR